MFIDTSCPGCRRKLRMEAKYAGQAAVCPVCHAQYTVPMQAKPELTPTDSWHIRTPDGVQYGPVSKETLDRWTQEGRIDHECRLMLESNGVWQGADAVYGELTPKVIMTTQKPSDDEQGLLRVTSPMRVINPHRAYQILSLGLLSWATGCAPLGFFAWMMGNVDLQAMKAGAMDPSGATLTRAGQLMGILNVVVASVAAIVVAGIVIIAAMKVF